MKPIFQTKFGKPEGNCLPACIASIFELPLDSVPHFCKIAGENYWKEIDKFLKPYGLYHLDIAFNQEYKRDLKGYHLINGKSPRGDYGHSIVGKDGIAIHDPHPKGNCILEKIESYTIFISIINNPPKI